MASWSGNLYFITIPLGLQPGVYGETSKFPFCDHKQTNKPQKMTNVGDLVYVTQICQWGLLCERSHMVVGAKVCELTDGFLWFVCGLYVGILTSPQ